MPGFGDLLRLTSQLPSAGSGSNGGLMESVQSAGNLLDRLVRALETLVQIEEPFKTNYEFDNPNIVGPIINDPFGPTPFVSRAVDVYIESTGTDNVTIQFLDANNQTAGYPGIVTLKPGDFRSYSVRSKGFIINCVSSAPFHVTYWG